MASTRGGSVGILSYQLMSTLLHLGRSCTFGGLRVEWFQPPLDVSGRLCVSSFSFISMILSQFMAKHVTGQFGLLILVAPCSIEVTWLSTVLNILIDIPHWCLNIKDVVMDVLVVQVLKGLQSLHLTLGSLSGSGRGNWNVPTMLERMDQMMCLRWCTKQ